jgi:YesN/AraC family two-component response regulator
MIPSLLFSALLFAIGYLGTHRSFTIDDILSAEIPEESDMTEEETPMEETSAEHNSKDTEKFEELALRITTLMKENKVFLQPDLNLMDLAQMLNTNQKYVYIAFSKVLDTKFSEYVNRLRIDYASHILQENPSLKLNEVAQMSGYSSSATFYRNFKQFLGCSPKEFLEKSKG